MGLPAMEKTLLLDVKVDSRVGFDAQSLPLIQHDRALRKRECFGSRKEDRGNVTSFKSSNDGESLSNTPRFISVVAGEEGWLPALVDAGRQEAELRSMEGAAGPAAGANDSEDDPREYYSDRDGSGVFFAVDLECVLHKYRRWHECFPNIKPFYAVKCNSNPEVVRVLAELPGCGFDCASPAEMDQVLRYGVDPSRIIYANPCKAPSALHHALSQGIFTMTFDSSDELYKIRRALDDRTNSHSVSSSGTSAVDHVELVLRVKVPDAHSDCPLGEKYGAIEEICSELITLTVELRLPLVGASFHCGSGCSDAQAYPDALRVTRFVFDLAARQGVILTLLDIGGGFPGWDGSECVYNQPQSSTCSKTTEESGPERADPTLDQAPPFQDQPDSFRIGKRSTSANGHTNPGASSSVNGSSTRPSVPLSPAGGVLNGASSPGEISLSGPIRVERSTSTTSTTSPNVAMGQGAVENCTSDGVATPSLPPLSLADIAKVTVPVLDKLFPPNSGVQIIAEPGRYFVEASHVLFARIYAKRRLHVKAADASGVRPSTKGTALTKTSTGTTTTFTTAYFIGEGLDGCFKDRVLCGVQFEPCPLRLATYKANQHFSLTPEGEGEGGGGRQERQLEAGDEDFMGKRVVASSISTSISPPVAVSIGPETNIPTENQEQRQINGDIFRQDKEQDGQAEGYRIEQETEDALVMGPSGSPGDVVARERLPRALQVGDWLYFSRMGAYTTSIASVAYSAAVEAPFCYVASAATAARGAVGNGEVGGRLVEEQGAETVSGSS